MENIEEIIKRRKSVRTFDERALLSEDKNKLLEYVKETDNPFGVPVEFRFLNAKEHKLSSPVIVGTDLYVAAKVECIPQFEIAYGYSFEKFCLYSESLGIGTVMLGGTLSRKSFEKAMDLKDNEVMPVATPIGYPAEKKSVREKLMRKVIKADERQPFEKLFFKNSFDTSLTLESAGKFAEALEMVRLAPSAVNKQPWRIVVCGDRAHFFKKRAKGFGAGSFDMQKIDMGIALAHFDLTMKEKGFEGNFIDDNPNIECDNSIEYIISCEVK